MSGLVNLDAERVSRHRYERRISRDPDGCWRMTTTRPDGYAVFGDRTAAWTHGELYAHRIAWRAAHSGQPIPAGWDVDHECGTRNCVNPAHLAVKPHAENCAGRRYSVRPRTALLTDAAVAEIRSHAAAGVSYADLGRRYRVSRQVIRNLVVGLTYQPLAPNPLTRITYQAAA